ncbi:MAG: hypothetical protein DMG65_01930 [Candidatus Angelobacter sp. Gp1-AA117]|nr:MAG: hypothetical protein DMG65_01930 [Candidatus Angelobacter sp. Gp1-AA117]
MFNIPQAEAAIHSLVDLLELRARHDRGTSAYTFLADEGTVEKETSYRELDEQARHVAARIMEEAKPGDRALLLYPPGLAFFPAFFGCLYASVIAVPAYPPHRNRNLLRLQTVFHDAQPKLVLTTSALLPRIRNAISALGAGAHISIIATDELPPAADLKYIRPQISQDTVAFLQYTSGSTANPKGVMLTHGNLLHNAELVNQAVGAAPDDSYVSWLPVFHDMGFMAGILQPLYRGLPAVLMAPAAFLEQPGRWLRAISRYRATASGGPSFAYDLCARRIPEADRQGMDLSSWSIAFNGAEPVRADVMERFAAAFSRCGFRPTAFYPCYGLAEATLMVSGGSKGLPAIVSEFDKRELENHCVSQPHVSERTQILVGCGRSLAGQEIAIVDPDSLQRCSPDRVGEIWVNGPSIAAGYWNNPQQSQETFHARIGGTGLPFLRTSDLGFLRDGQLFVTGRIKDLLIIRGQNHYPQDIELTVERSHAALQPGSGAAFSVEAGSEERLVVVHEAANRAGTDWEKIFASIRQAIAEHHELSPYAIVLVRTGTIPKTSSGKIQRRASKEAFIKGELHVLGEWHENETSEPGDVSLNRATAPSALPSQLLSEIAAKLGIAPDKIDLHQPLTAYGLDSLVAIELVHRLQTDFGLDLKISDLFEGMTLAGLLHQAEQTRVAQPPPAVERDLYEKSAPPQTYPLSHGQRALWFLQQMAPESTVYNIARAVRITSRVEVDLLRGAFQHLLDRHPALRTTFAAVEGEPFQQVQQGTGVCFERVEATGWGDARFAEVLAEESRKAFDLVNGPLFRVHLYSRSETDHVLQFVVHHLVADFWSLMVLLGELGQLYRSPLGKTSAALPLLTYSYADFVSWQERLISGPEGERLWSFWQQELSGELAALNLPADHSRPAVSSFPGSSLDFVIKPKFAVPLRQMAAGQLTTLFTVLLAAFQALLHRLTAQERFAIGVPTSGRSRAEFSGLVGYFVNVLPLVADFSGAKTFPEFLSGLKQRSIASFAHDQYPFPLMVEKLGIPRSFNSSPIFQTMFVFQKAWAGQSSDSVALAMNQSGARLEIGGLKIEAFAMQEQTAEFDLVLNMGESQDGFIGTWQYSTDLFDATTIERWNQSFQWLLQGIVEHLQCRVTDLPIIPEKEQARLLLDFNQTELPYDRQRLLHQQIEHRAKRHPERTAVAWGDVHLNYGDLDRRADQMARHLHHHGIGSEDFAGVCIHRSPEMVIAMLGIWKAGAAYVPLDPQYPHQRVRFMLEDSRAKIVITEKTLRERVEGTSALVIDVEELASTGKEYSSIIPKPSFSEQLAYLIYTSGSTGTPKGVMLTHRSIASFIEWARNTFSEEEFSGVLATTSICFDLSIFELWATLSCGGTVILAENILQWCDSYDSRKEQPQVKLINTVPSAMEQLLQRRLPASVSAVNLAGEALQQALVQKIYEAGHVKRVNNLYGPTETTTYSSWTTVDAQGLVTIGGPVANTQLYVIDRQLQTVPMGVTGELCIAGAGLARGYWQHPDWTAERFLPDSFSRTPGARMFRTGDLVRWRPDGQLLYLGRADQQVKVRGFRIELGEISAVLGKWDAVRESAVIVVDDRGSKYLAAYVSPRANLDLTPERIREYLQHRLPEYMVPNHIILLPELPKTSSGKVDRKALPHPQRPHTQSRMPASTMEREVAEIWQEVLGMEKVGAEDDFFLLGGHSLLMMQLRAKLEVRLHRTVPLARLLQSATVAGMASTLEPVSATHPFPPVKHAGNGPIELSFAQERIWFLEQMHSGLPVYNIAGAVRLPGELDMRALDQSLRHVIQRHAILRTAFTLNEGKPLQQVHETTDFALEETDLRGTPAVQMEQQRNRELRQEATGIFSLEHPGLIRARLFRTADCDCTLMLVLHHIIADGWSIGVLLSEIENLYPAYRDGKPASLPPLEFQFTDYAVWQRDLLESGKLDEGLAYWKSQLSGAPPVLDLPVDTPRPLQPEYGGSLIRFALNKQLQRNVTDLSHREALTPYVLLLTAFQVLLSRYSGETDIVVGSPVADRLQVESQELVGLFANLLPLRTQIDPEGSFLSLLNQSKMTVAEAQTWQHIPFEKIVEQVEAHREFSRMPLVQVVFAWQVGLMGMVRLGEIVAQPQTVHTGTSKFDLTLTIEEDKDTGLFGWIEYSTEIFAAGTIRQIANRYVRFLEQIMSNPAQRIGDISLFSPEEKKQVLQQWNGMPLQPATGCVHAWFEQHVRQSPEATALRVEGRSLNYGTLNAMANQVAHALLARGIGQEMVVGICVERNKWMIMAILATLKAGAAYLPLNHEYPSERLAYMLADAGAAFILTEEATAEKLLNQAVPMMFVDRERREWEVQSTKDPAIRVYESNLAYIIYTSGSTGQPKGVMVQHGNLSGLLSTADTYFSFRPDDRWTMFHLYSFDFSVWEIWGALAYGGTLVIVSAEARRSPREFYKLLREEQISILSQVPSSFYQLLEETCGTAAPGCAEDSKLLNLRAIVFGGEALDVKRLDSWTQRKQEHAPLLVNMYGITETTIHVTYKQLEAADIEAGRSVIGSPLKGYRVYLLDERQMLVPPGIPGELYVGGIGVARGYLNRPDLTAERFVPNLFAHERGARLYRTGDRARYLADGTIEYLGRLDHQVKIRGYRIELGEIESTLKRHSAVLDCAVLVKDQRMFACIVPAEAGAVNYANLRAYMRSELPDYMVPAQFIALEHLPLTPNGKIDRKRLLQLESNETAESTSSVALSPTEELIAGIWSSLLGVPEFSPESNFFDLGGHSLLATQMVLQLRNVFGCEVPLRFIFEFPVLKDLAHHIRTLTGTPSAAGITSIHSRTGTGRLSLSSGQQRLWFLDQFTGSSSAYNIAGAARLTGELNVEALKQSFQAMILRHEILRTSFVEYQGRPQQVLQEVQFNIETTDLTGYLDRDVLGPKFMQELQRESTRPFVLSQPSLLRAVLFRLNDQEHVLLVSMHHIIADAWSIDLLIRELVQLYNFYTASEKYSLPELPFQYADYAAWEEERWTKGEFSAGLEYWKKQLADAPILELPADFPREATPTYQGRTLRATLDAELGRKMHHLARSENVTLFMLLLATYQVLLSQYTGEEDVVVGISIANRNVSGTEHLIGLFTNEVVLRTRLHGDPSFRELLARVRETTLSAYAHQDIPFGKLVEALRPDRDFSRNPFFQTTVLLHQDPLPQMKFGSLDLDPIELDIESTVFDASLEFTIGSKDEIHVALRHSTRFKAERMERLLQDVTVLLNRMVATPEAHLSQLRKSLRSEPAIALAGQRSWAGFVPVADSVPQLFEQQVAASPEQMAVSYEQTSLTFAELNEGANRVANYLLSLGIKNEDSVALCMERSVELLVAILGILKAGAAYVPLDRTYPPQRVRYILKETAAAAILTQNSLVSLFASAPCNVICLEDGGVTESSSLNPAVVIHPANLAYVIYTSGSTGEPKGVMVQHGSVLNLLEGLEQVLFCRLPSPVCVSMNAPVVFDASVQQWIRLLKGDTVCILPEEKRFDPEALISYMNENKIDVLDCTPSLLRLLLAESVDMYCKAMLVGGEAIDAPTWGQLRERRQTWFVNVYGPTECTVDVTACNVSDSTQPSIGLPLNNVDAYILNRNLHLVPQGEMGELYVAGAGLARGYYHRPDLTAEHFIPDDFSGIADSRLYRTGDLARVLPSGQFEFCGRSDDQVKIRGYRVELEEIISVLRRIEGVQDAVVIASDTRLLAFVAPGPGATLDTERLRDHLRQYVPEYMVPSSFIFMEALPLTVNGKTDRQALLRASEGQRVASSAHAPARNRMEETVSGIWQEVLGFQQFGIHDNFFDLGGHSLSMVQVRSRLREALQKEVPMVELFRNPTIALLAQYLAQGEARTPSLQIAQTRAGRRIAAARRGAEPVRSSPNE